jgi:hypothetical protein
MQVQIANKFAGSTSVCPECNSENVLCNHDHIVNFKASRVAKLAPDDDDDMRFKPEAEISIAWT